MAIRGNCSAFGESSLTLSANGSDQVCLGLGIKTFDTQQHHRRAPVASNGKVRVKIMVQRDTNAFVVPRSFQNEAVLCLFHSDFCHMNRLEALFTKDRCCAGSEPLVLSCNAIDAESLIVDGSGCEAQCLLNVFRLEKGVFGEKGITARISPSSSRTRRTVILIPRIHGFPAHLPGSTVMRSNGSAAVM